MDCFNFLPCFAFNLLIVAVFLYNFAAISADYDYFKQAADVYISLQIPETFFSADVPVGDSFFFCPKGRS